MDRSWKQALLFSLVAVASLIVVADVSAWPFRRRWRVNNNASYGGYNTSARMYSYGPGYGTYGAGVTAGAAVPGATVTAPGVGVNVTPAGYGAAVTAPGVGVNAGPGGAAIRAPGVGVNAGRGGATLSAPGVGVQAGPGGAGISAPGAGATAPGAGANLRGGASADLPPPGPGPDANLRVRGQSPDDNAPPRRGDNEAPRPQPLQNQPPRSEAPAP
jgi:hypothetical protein